MVSWESCVIGSWIKYELERSYEMSHTCVILQWQTKNHDLRLVILDFPLLFASDKSAIDNDVQQLLPILSNY